jgi:putative phosphoesterase
MINSGRVRLLVIADTHLAAGQGHRLLDRLPRLLPTADVILHAGDVVDASVLALLAEHAPVHAVLGNNDHGMSLPERLVLRLGGCQVAMVHDSGPSAGRAARLGRWFPTADLVVFGHSHIPWHQTYEFDDGRVQHHLNPGSAMQRRRQPHCTVAMVQLRAGNVGDISHVHVPSEVA